MNHHNTAPTTLLQQQLEQEKQQRQELVLTTTDSTSSSSSIACLWDIITGDTVTSFKHNASPVHGAVFSSSHNAVLSAQSDKNLIHIYSNRKDEVKFKCPQGERIRCLEVSGGDDVYCFGGSSSGNLYIWMISTGRLLRIIEAHMKAITTIRYIGGMIVTAAEDTLIKVWNIADLLDRRQDAAMTAKLAEPVRTLSGHSLPITDIAVSPAGASHARVFSASLDRTVKAWDLSSGTQLCSVAFPAALTSVAVDWVEHNVFAGADDGHIYQVPLYRIRPEAAAAGSAGVGSSIFDVTLQDTEMVFRGHTQAVLCVQVTHDGRRIVSGSRDGTIRVWDMDTKQTIRSTAKHSMGTGLSSSSSSSSLSSSGRKNEAVTNLILVSETHSNRDALNTAPLKKFVSPQEEGGDEDVNSVIEGMVGIQRLRQQDNQLTVSQSGDIDAETIPMPIADYSESGGIDKKQELRRILSQDQDQHWLSSSHVTHQEPFTHRSLNFEIKSLLNKLQNNNNNNEKNENNSSSIKYNNTENQKNEIENENQDEETIIKLNNNDNNSSSSTLGKQKHPSEMKHNEDHQISFEHKNEKQKSKQNSKQKESQKKKKKNSTDSTQDQLKDIFVGSENGTEENKTHESKNKNKNNNNNKNKKKKRTRQQKKRDKLARIKRTKKNRPNHFMQKLE